VQARDGILPHVGSTPGRRSYAVVSSSHRNNSLWMPSRHAHHAVPNGGEVGARRHDWIQDSISIVRPLPILITSSSDHTFRQHTLPPIIASTGNIAHSLASSTSSSSMQAYGSMRTVAAATLSPPAPLHWAPRLSYRRLTLRTPITSPVMSEPGPMFILDLLPPSTSPPACAQTHPQQSQVVYSRHNHEGQIMQMTSKQGT
jgi:hypothetical protein